MPIPRACLTLLLLLPVPAAAETPPFSKSVAPLLRSRCLKCHSEDKARGDLKLTTRVAMLAAVKPGKADESLLFTHVRDGKMPPKQPLPADEVELLRRWIEAGATWDVPELRPDATPVSRAVEDWWSLRPVRRSPMPGVKDGSRVRTPLDAFLLAKLEEKGLSFAPEADRRTLIRRLTFDLLGLAPTFDEVEAFANDPRPDAYERLVDRLLASPHHGERWGRHWLDVARFAESHGYEMNTLRPNAWPYRDYVIRAFNHDVPYRQFVREQLAGDRLGRDDFLTGAATGFLVGGPHDLVGNATPEGKLQQRADDLHDVVSTVGATFLGLTVGCARCHDHKFDPISQRDYYALQAVFAGLEHADRPFRPADEKSPLLAQARRRLAEVERQLDELEPLVGASSRPPVNPRRNVERFRPVAARFVRFVIAATNDGTEPCLDELEVYGPGDAGNLALAHRGVKLSASSVYPNAAIHKLEHLNDGVVGNSRSWISAERGQGWVRLELPAEVTIDRVVWGRDREERFRDRLASGYRVEVSRDGVSWQAVAGSDDRSRTEGTPAPEGKVLRQEADRLLAEIARLREPVKAYAGTFRTPDGVHRLKRGDVTQKLEAVAPGVLQAVPPGIPREGEARLTVADWLGHDDNPLTARVWVNRVWQWHFGTGLVATPSDFGRNGARPSHPELLDWLAAEFRDGGGAPKRLHRLIVLSSAYRQSGRRDARAAAIDADNRLLWRMAPRRLEAEAIRDGMLQASGELNTRMGGPGYHLWEYSGYVIAFTPKKALGSAEFRRMVYQFKPRLQQDGTFGAFDCPDATAAQPRRNASTTALQALNLLNDPFVLARADGLAGRVRCEAGDDPAAQVRHAIRLAFGRDPSDGEREAGVRLVECHGLPLLCRALLNANEFVFVH
ncbi:MAG: PSD1 and planctomycete cytochrome C domain-containing protein [Gemmataceae bacterium]